MQTHARLFLCFRSSWSNAVLIPENDHSGALTEPTARAWTRHFLPLYESDTFGLYLDDVPRDSHTRDRGEQEVERKTQVIIEYPQWRCTDLSTYSSLLEHQAINCAVLYIKRARCG